MQMQCTQEDPEGAAIMIVTVLSVLPTAALLDFVRQLQDMDQTQEMDVCM